MSASNITFARHAAMLQMIVEDIRRSRTAASAPGEVEEIASSLDHLAVELLHVEREHSWKEQPAGALALCPEQQLPA